MVSVLGVLVAEGAVVGLLEAMSLAAFCCPQSAMESNPEEELDFVRAADGPQFLGPAHCDAAYEEGTVGRGTRVRTVRSPAPDHRVWGERVELYTVQEGPKSNELGHVRDRGCRSPVPCPLIVL